jgi:two-component system response regulator RegX3
MPRVLLIEDEEGLASALEYQLTREGFDVDLVADGSLGLSHFKKKGADLILLDLMLPGMSGEEVCKEIRKQSSVPIIMLTAKGEEIDRILGLELGADDYVTKPFSTRELTARARAVLRRSGGGSEAEVGVLEGGGIRLDPDRFEITFRGDAVHLSRKEFDLLYYLMENVGRALPRDRIIEEVWGSDYFGDTRTLDVHIKRLRDKLESEPHSPKHLLTVRGVGYKFVA